MQRRTLTTRAEIAKKFPITYTFPSFLIIYSKTRGYLSFNHHYFSLCRKKILRTPQFFLKKFYIYMIFYILYLAFYSGIQQSFRYILQDSFIYFSFVVILYSYNPLFL